MNHFDTEGIVAKKDISDTATRIFIGRFPPARFDFISAIKICGRLTHQTEVFAGIFIEDHCEMDASLRVLLDRLNERGFPASAIP